MKPKIILPILAVVAFGLLGLLFYLDKQVAPRPVASGIGLEGYAGDVNPSFVVDKIGGGKVSLDDYKDKVIIVDFWATWCGPCVESIAHLNELQTEYASKGLVVIGLTVDRDLGPVPSFISDHKIIYPIGIATPTEVELFGGVSAIPTMIILNKKHQVVAKLIGYQEKETLNTILLPLL